MCNYPNLQQLIVNWDCLKNVHGLIISDNPQLEKIIIESHDFKFFAHSVTFKSN